MAELSQLSLEVSNTEQKPRLHNCVAIYDNATMTPQPGSCHKHQKILRYFARQPAAFCLKMLYQKKPMAPSKDCCLFSKKQSRFTKEIACSFKCLLFFFEQEADRVGASKIKCKIKMHGQILNAFTNFRFSPREGFQLSLHSNF